jgi:hypothetical protein
VQEGGDVMTEDYARDWRDDTITGFPAVSGDTEVIPAVAEACACGMCPDSREPGKDALLSCAPGVTSRMWRTRVANGQWDDIGAIADAGHARTHLPALKTNRRIHADVAGKRHDLGAVFTRNPLLLPDLALARELHDLEATLEERLASMRLEAAREEARIRSEEQARAWTGTERAA